MKFDIKDNPNLNFTHAQPGDVMVLEDGTVALRVLYTGLRTCNAVILRPHPELSWALGTTMELSVTDKVVRIIPSSRLALTEVDDD